MVALMPPTLDDMRELEAELDGLIADLRDDGLLPVLCARLALAGVDAVVAPPATPAATRAARAALAAPKLAIAMDEALESAPSKRVAKPDMAPVTVNSARPAPAPGKWIAPLSATKPKRARR